eukprot:1196261-Prorocentrum_minimum.AAC.1
MICSATRKFHQSGSSAQNHRVDTNRSSWFPYMRLPRLLSGRPRQLIEHPLIELAGSLGTTVGE